jgi:cytochrome c biogenesis protein CcdA
MNIAGLPLHVLVVHAAVVFGPLSALAALAYVAVPRYRDLLRWPTLVLVLVATAAIWLAFFSGESFYDSDRFANVSGEL